MKILHYITITILVSFFSACSTISLHHNTKEKVITKHHKSSSSLYYLALDNVSSHYPKTGFYPLTDNQDALMARIVLIDNAKKSLDLQYYTYADDAIGLVLLEHIIKAADRGVKVRLLIDDLLEKDSDAEVATIAKHKNIDIKFFNPTPMRKFMGWLQLGLNIDTFGRRMHNKLFIADNSAVILGGRNIQNIYFSADKEDIFVDNDVLAIGPLASQASNEFETYWNSFVVKDIKHIAQGQKALDYKLLKDKIFQITHSIHSKEYVEEATKRDFMQSARKNKIPLIYGKAQLYFDMPSKIVTSEDDTSTHLSVKLIPYVLNAKKSLKIINPYFIPNKQMIKELQKLRDKGVEIYIVTNSLATNDGITVYGSYSKYQKTLLKMGVHLYELNPNSFSYLYKNQKYRKGKIPKSSLHAKNMIIDDEIFVVGSANLDPRSLKLNTEVVAVIHSKELAKIESKVFQTLIQPKNVFKLELEKNIIEKDDPVAKIIPLEKEKIVWITQEHNKTVRYYNDGNAGFWRRFGSNLSRYLPLDKYL